MKRFNVYILKCADDKYYTGITNDIERRLIEHQSGENSKAFTFNRRPVSLVYCEHFHEPKVAIEWEKQVKSWSQKKKEALIAENWDKLKEFSRCLNQTSHFIYNEKIESLKNET